MSLGDRIRGFFGKRNNPELRGLEEFASARRGVEGYIEPRTATHPTSLLLVDRDGDHRRAGVKEPADAVAFCEARGIPVYDASVIGYPRRMKEFERRRGASPDRSLDEQFEELERRFHEPGADAPDR
ncbi:MAG TPA: hypothetical protein VHJ34_13390 [Actinomycetota bacterium]|nr:hypothetical protein [Actinomycetota bacterium]